MLRRNVIIVRSLFFFLMLEEWREREREEKEREKRKRKGREESRGPRQC